MEEKDVLTFETDKHIIYSDGRIYSKYWKKFISGSINKGYAVFTRKILGETKLHRIIAKCFIPNPNNYPCVNHKDENKLNNDYRNLEWCTHEYNIKYGTAIERRAKTQRNGKSGNGSKQVYQYTLDGKLVNVFPSTRECERNGYNNTNVSACCRGGYFDKKRNKWINAKKYKNYIWSYAPLQFDDVEQ